MQFISISAKIFVEILSICKSLLELSSTQAQKKRKFKISHGGMFFSCQFSPKCLRHSAHYISKKRAWFKWKAITKVYRSIRYIFISYFWFKIRTLSNLHPWKIVGYYLINIGECLFIIWKVSHTLSPSLLILGIFSCFTWFFILWNIFLRPLCLLGT